MNEDGLGLFNGKDQPTVEWGWKNYEKAVAYNTTVGLQETVKANENFFIGKQWEGVEANGLPTPVFNFLKRVGGFTIANLVSDSIKINASVLSAFPEDDKLIDPVRIVNDEMDALSEQNRIPSLAKAFARDAAVRGDGCIFTWWDAKADAGPYGKGRIRSELLGHRLDSDKGYGCSNRLCAHFDECLRRTFSAHGEVLRKNSRGCFESCPDFREATCHRLARPPFVCNGCEHERGCPLKKKFYVATAAQAGYETTLRLSRTGIHPSDDDIGRMNAVLSPSIRKGQSVSAVMSAHGDVFKGFGRSTVYGWIEAGLFSAKGHDLPYSGRSRKPKPRPVTKTNARCRIGRTIREMREWLKAHPDVVPCELDTVIGSVSGKVLFTMIFPKSGLALGFLRDQKTSQTCTRIFNMLWTVAGPKLFRGPARYSSRMYASSSRTGSPMERGRSSSPRRKYLYLIRGRMSRRNVSRSPSAGK